jgi:hypothetical protein
VGVDLGGGDVGVTQHLLDVPQGHSSAQHMRGEGVAQRVRRYAIAEVRGLGVSLQDEPETLAGQALTAAVDE